MKEDLYDDLYLEEKEEKTDFKAVLFKYTIHWPWFVAFILLCLSLIHISLDVDQNELGISSKENSQEGQTIIYSCLLYTSHFS